MRPTRAAGYGLAALSVLTVAFMAMHPTSGTHDHGEFVARAGRGIPGNAIVHGSLVTIMLIMATCFLWLRDLLGAHRPIVRAGMVAMVVGTAGAVVAGLVNGFIVPDVSAHYLDGGVNDLNALKPVLVLAQETNATCARVSVLGLSLAAIAWSACLIRMTGWRRVVGVVGLACGLAPVALLFGAYLGMNVEGYGLFVKINALWNLLAGVVLIRHRPER